MERMWRIFRKQSTIDVEDEVDAHLLSALQHLHARLLASQPRFTEEDVVIMAHPTPSGSPAHSPAASPRDLDAEQKTHDGTRRVSANDDVETKHFTAASGVCCSSSGGTASPYSSQHAASSPSAVMDLDEPMTCSQFLTIVKRFDAKALLRNRKAAADSLRLLNHGYALTWRDAEHLQKIKLRGRVGASRCATSARGDTVGYGDTFISMTLRCRIAAFSSSSTQTYKPAAKLVALMGSCVESLLVYANESPSLRNMVASNAALLGLLCFICVEARRLDAAPDNKSSWRDVDAELNELTVHWQAFPVTMPLLETLRECYLLEFLLDVALPPTVCSTKYTGMEMALCEKKERLLMDMVSGRAGLGVLTKDVPLRGLAAIVSMFTFVEPKLRARALDRMAGEGLVLILRDEICGAARESSVHASACARGGECPSPSKKKGTLSILSRSISPWRSTGFGFSQPEEVKPVSSERGPFDIQESAARRLGYCLDVLHWLTAPNLVRETDTVKNTKGVVRATAWASRTEDLRDICSCLLRLSSTRLYGSPLSHPHPLQEQGVDCVRQIASYSAALYSVVVEALDELLDEYKQRGEIRRGDSRASLLPLFLDMLQLRQHAEANEEYVQRWFTWLAESLVPRAFDVPVLTCDGNGGSGRTRSWPRNGKPKSSNMRREAPILARDLTRDEMLSLSPYFRFASRLVSETTWRHGAEPFLARIALLAYNVLLTQARRPNLIFGQASACYDAVAPLLETPYGVTPGESVVDARALFTTPTRHSEKRSDGGLSPVSPGRKRCRTDSRCSTAGRSSGDGEEEVFIPSPSQSPLFLEVYSPSARDADEPRGSEELPRWDASPSSDMTAASWRRRLSLSTFLAALGECYRD